MQPPSPEPRLKFVEPLHEGATREVDRIRDEALSLGWTEAQLYQNKGILRFPSGGTYGLICFLKAGRTVSRVTADAIRIDCPTGARMTFHRPGRPNHPAIERVR